MSTAVIDIAELSWRLAMLRIRRGRERLGKDYTLGQISEATGIPQSTLSRWERGIGKRGPDSRSLDKLAGFYQVSLGDLLNPGFDTRVWLNTAA